MEHYLYNSDLEREVMEVGLERWRKAAKKWQNSYGQGTAYSKPLSSILWALDTHQDYILSYADTGITNAGTEIINAKIRRLLRHGRRYDTATIVALVNADLTAEQDASLASEQWVRADSYGVSVPQSAREVNGQPVGKQLAGEQVSKQLRAVQESNATPLGNEAEPKEKPQPQKRRRQPPSRSRMIAMHPELGLPSHVWQWYRSRVHARKQGPFWFNVVLDLASDEHRKCWQQFTGGGPLKNCLEYSLHLWQAQVLSRYLAEQGGPYSETLRGLNVCGLAERDPFLAVHLRELWLRRAEDQVTHPTPEETQWLEALKRWQGRLVLSDADFWAELQLEEHPGGLVRRWIRSTSSTIDAALLSKQLYNLNDNQIAKLRIGDWLEWQLFCHTLGVKLMQHSHWLGQLISNLEEIEGSAEL